MTTTVLTDGPFTITWNGGHTFNVWALDREVNMFSSNYGEQTTEDQARKHAHEWWTGKGWDERSGKEDTQALIRFHS